MAREATGVLNSFGVEDFDYGNSVVTDQMMSNWEHISFMGITVSMLCFTFGMGGKSCRGLYIVGSCVVR